MKLEEVPYSVVLEQQYYFFKQLSISSKDPPHLTVGILASWAFEQRDTVVSAWKKV